MKINFEILNKIAYGMHHGAITNPFWTSIVGGFGEGPEGCACAALSREKANELINFMVSKYEPSVTPEKAPPGYSFNELYDFESVNVMDEYLALYHKV